MIYITGDTHGDLKSYKRRSVRLKKNDFLIICGDFGFFWDDTEEERKALDYLKKRKYNILFLDGCHENFSLLEQYEETIFQGGRARKIADNIYHLLRGEVYNIEERTVFAFGGGVSPDLKLIMDTPHWSEKEAPTDEQMQTAINNLKKHGGKVDYILTHEPPGIVKRRFMARNEIHDINFFLDEINKAVKYEQWFFGSLHIDKVISDRMFAVYDDVLPVGKVVKARKF